LRLGHARKRRWQVLKEFSIPMKRSITLALLLASGITLDFALAAASQAPPAAGQDKAGPAKIAVIAFQAAVGQTNEGQRNFADLQKKYEPKRQHLKALSDEIESLTKQLQTQSEKLSDAERASRARTIDEKKKQLERSAEEARNDYQGEMQELYNGLASKVYDVLASYAQQQGYTLVLEMGRQQSPVLFANPAIDITKAVLEAYNVKSGVPAPPAKPATAAAPRPASQSAKPAAAH
jgi:outer membrane protein